MRINTIVLYTRISNLLDSSACIHSVHFKTEPKNHTENKPNQTDFMVFMVSGFGMVWTFHTDLNFGFYGIYQKTEWLTE